LPQEWTDLLRSIQIDECTDSPVDWMHTMAHAARLVLVDSKKTPGPLTGPGG